MMVDNGLTKDPLLNEQKRLKLVWLDHYKGEVVSSMWWDPQKLKYRWFLKGNKVDVELNTDLKEAKKNDRTI